MELIEISDRMFRPGLIEARGLVFRGLWKIPAPFSSEMERGLPHDRIDEVISSHDGSC